MHSGTWGMDTYNFELMLYPGNTSHFLSQYVLVQPPFLYLFVTRMNIYWYEARVLSLEPWAPRIGRAPNCERRRPLRNPYPKSIILFRIYVRMRRWHLVASMKCGRLLGSASKAAMAAFAKSEGFSEGCPMVYSIAGFCPCLFVYRDRLDKSSVITSLFPPLFDYLRKALVLPTLLLKEDNSLIRWVLSIVQVSTPFVRTTNSFHWVSEWKWMSLWSYPHSMQCEEPSDQCFPGASPTRSRQLLTGNGIRGTRFPGPSIDLLWEKAVSTG